MELATAFLNRTQNSFYKDFILKLYSFLNTVINASGWMDGWVDGWMGLEWEHGI